MQVCEPALSRGHVEAVGEVNLVSFPTGIVSRLMPIGNPSCGAWSMGRGGGTEALGYMVPLVPALTTHVKLALYHSQPAPLPHRATSAKGWEGKKGLIERSDCPG